MPIPALRPYQAEALKAQKHRHLTVLPTGTGKTRILAELALQRPTLIVVHREELLDQTRRAIQAVKPGTHVGVVQGPRNEWRGITIAMADTLRNRLDEAQQRLHGKSAFHILVDEAHRYTSDKTGRAILDAFEDHAAIYGFTATPQIHRKPIYGPGMPWVGIAFRRSVVSMIREGYLCDVVGETVKWNDLDLSKVKKSRGDYTAASLGAAMTRIHAPERIVEAWEEKAKDRQRTIVFTPTVEFGGQVTRAFRDRGHAKVLEVYGSTPTALRRVAIDHFRQGKCNVLVNVLVGAEGFDVPEVDCVVQARPTRSWTLYVQSVGRGLRPAPGKKNLLVLDIAGSAQEHDLASLPKCFELSKFWGKGKKSVREATAGREGREIELEQGKAAFEELLLYTPVQWTAWHEERIAVAGESGVVILAPVEGEVGDPLGWGVFYADVHTGREETLGEFDYPADAQEFAEDWIRENGDPKLYQRSRKWRRLPPSAAQARWFQKGQVPETRGEASERITLHLYKRWRRG